VKAREKNRAAMLKNRAQWGEKGKKKKMSIKLLDGDNAGGKMVETCSSSRLKIRKKTPQGGGGGIEEEKKGEGGIRQDSEHPREGGLGKNQHAFFDQIEAGSGKEGGTTSY